MKKKLQVFLPLIGLVFLAIPIVVYFAKFHKLHLSDNLSDWAQFGDYLNGTFMPLIALAGLSITLILGIIDNQRNKTNILLEQQKQRPLLHISYFDGEDCIKLCMENKGNGPLIINNYYLERIQSSSQNDNIRNSIFECLPPNIDSVFDTYTGNLNNLVLSPSEHYLLLQITSENLEGDALEIFEEDRNIIRIFLGYYKFVVEYSDVYNNKMPRYEKELSWFHRHVELSREEIVLVEELENS